MKHLSSRVVAITGAGSGIGQALAVELAKQGSHLALSDISADNLAQTRALAQRPGINITTHTVDVSNKQQVDDWARVVVETHGQVNVVINNAGVALSGTVDSLSMEDYEWIMQINFWGVVYGTKAFLPYLEASGAGHIVNISSVFGLTSQPLMSGYNASKFAVRGFTESLRQDLELTSSCVSTTCVHPGGIKTNIAKAARVNDSVKSVTGHNDDAATKEFEQTFLTTPQTAAKTIIKAIRRNKRRVLVGPDARLYDLVSRTFPTAYQKLFTAVVRARSARA